MIEKRLPARFYRSSTGNEPVRDWLKQLTPSERKIMTNPYIGSSLDEFLEEEDILGEVYAIAIKRVLVWQIEQEMQKQGLNKSQMAEAMGTSRASLNRLLDPANTSITLKTMERAAAIVGKRLHITLEDPENLKSAS